MINECRITRGELYMLCGVFFGLGIVAAGLAVSIVTLL